MYRRLQGHQAVATMTKVTGCAYRLPHDGTLDYRRRRITQPGYAWSGSFASRFVNSGPAGKKLLRRPGMCKSSRIICEKRISTH